MINQMKQKLILLRKLIEKNTDGIQYHHGQVQAQKYVNASAFWYNSHVNLKMHNEYWRMKKRDKSRANLWRNLFIDILIESL